MICNFVQIHTTLLIVLGILALAVLFLVVTIRAVRKRKWEAEHPFILKGHRTPEQNRKRHLRRIREHSRGISRRVGSGKRWVGVYAD